MNRWIARLVAVGALVLVWSACETEKHIVVDDDEGTGASGGSVGGGPSGAACDDYINCVTAASPATLDDVLAAYGPMGSCFQSLPLDQCLQACFSGMQMLGAAYPNVPACGGTPGTGGGGVGGNGAGGFPGNGNCASCSDYVFGPAVFEDLCGYNPGNDTCAANSSCSFVEDVAACTCGPCVAACQDVCNGTGDATPNCQNCITTTCADEFNACTGDLGTG
jgi:hypothetical protein